MKRMCQKIRQAFDSFFPLPKFFFRIWASHLITQILTKGTHSQLFCAQNTI